MKAYKVCMTIAGSDPSGGAGIQADLKTFHRHGCYGQAVITALTVQNSLGVSACHDVDSDLIEVQIANVMDDLMPDAVKIGMVGSAAAVDAIATCIEHFKPGFVVLDPIIFSSSGYPLTDEETARRMFDRLAPRCHLLTPNLPEAQYIARRPHETDAHLLLASLRERFPGLSILLKGGHGEGAPTDYLLPSDGKVISFEGKHISSANTHGTGCVLSSAITANMANGMPLAQAVGEAKAFVEQAIMKGSGYYAGKGHGALYLL